MALSQNGDPNLLHHIVLADDDLPHFPQNFLRYFVHISLRLLQITMPAATTTTAALRGDPYYGARTEVVTSAATRKAHMPAPDPPA